MSEKTINPNSPEGLMLEAMKVHMINEGPEQTLKMLASQMIELTMAVGGAFTQIRAEDGVVVVSVNCPDRVVH